MEWIINSNQIAVLGILTIAAAAGFACIVFQTSKPRFSYKNKKRFHISRILIAVLVLTSLFSLGQFSTGPTFLSASAESINPVIFWNQLTTELGLEAKLPVPRLQRAYALVHVAIYDALLLAQNQHRPNLSEDTVIAGAASEVLTFLFPNEVARIKEAEFSQADMGQGQERGKAVSDLRLGHAVGKQVVKYAKNDGSDVVFTGSIPSGDCIWNGMNPLEPMAGTWKTWVLTSGAEIQPPPPHPCGSELDLFDVQEVLDAALGRTVEQTAIALKWRPPTNLQNGILEEEVESRGLGTFESARAYVYVNIAMYDSIISTWLAKYTSWMARPSMRIIDPDFTTVFPTPNHPSYPSGHSTYCGAWEVVMGELFPDEKDSFREQAEECAISRFYAGIHFTNDDNQGLNVGRQVGEKVIIDMLGPPHQFVGHKDHTK